MMCAEGGEHVHPPRVVLETYGAMGPGAEAWFRGCIAVAELQRPEWVEEDEEMGMEWERWARAQLSADWQRRISITLQRGNARVLRSGVLRARSGVGVRVYGRMGGCTFSWMWARETSSRAEPGHTLDTHA